MEKFEKELEQLINKYSKENDSNTPDFILAEYLSNSLKTFNTTLQRRETWYGRNFSSKKIDTFQDDAIMLENAASDHNYHFYCAKATLGICRPITPYDLLDQDFGRVRSASEKQAISKILRERNISCDASRNAYDDWEITLVKTNGCLCGHNGKRIPTNSTIETVKVRDKFYGLGQRVKNDGVIEKFQYMNGSNRVTAIVKYSLNCPFKYYKKNIDIVNLR